MVTLDLCTQSHCAGWAVRNGVPAQLDLRLNGEHVALIDCDVDRPDLVSHGLPRTAGFSFVFPQPLKMSDAVDVRFVDGGSLRNSPSVQHRARLGALLAGIPLGERGLELGPLDRPILGKADHDVLYVDHASREALIEKYRKTGSLATVRPERIVEVDFIWDRPLRDSAVGGYAYCLASHVIEHVADPIGWLIEIADVLRVGGRLNLPYRNAAGRSITGGRRRRRR